MNRWNLCRKLDLDFWIFIFWQHSQTNKRGFYVKFSRQITNWASYFILSVNFVYIIHCINDSSLLSHCSVSSQVSLELMRTSGRDSIHTCSVIKKEVLLSKNVLLKLLLLDSMIWHFLKRDIAYSTLIYGLLIETLWIFFLWWW